MNDTSLSFLCPNGHLSYAPLRPESFHLGVEACPDYIAADAGSCDIGPVPLGSDRWFASPLKWQTSDLEYMLLASRKLGVSMIIGSAGDTGANSRVDLFVSIIQELAVKHRLPKFKLGYFYSNVSKEYLRDKMARSETIQGLDNRPDLTEEELNATDNIVAVAGVHPYIRLLEMGADVIIGGRSSDCAIFAAPAIHKGFPEGVAYYLGKVLECASFCAEPYGGKESIIGRIWDDAVTVTAMHPDQRCTVASVASHAMYERATPFYEYVAGGMLDMRDCRYEQLDPRTTRITGPRFIPASRVRVKLEGAGKCGERFIGMSAIRDPYTVANIDKVIAWCRNEVSNRLGHDGYELYMHVFGKNGVMGELEPVKTPAHELCIVVEAVSPNAELGEEVCMTATRQMFYARLPEVKGTAGGAAVFLDEVMQARPAYRWTMNHTVAVDDPMELFPTQMTCAGVSGEER